MAFETGSATGPVDLLDKLRIFAVANGLIVDDFRVESGKQTLYINDGITYYQIQFQPSPSLGASRIKLIPATGFNSGSNFGQQPNSATNGASGRETTCNYLLDASIPTYYFSYLPGGILTTVILTSQGHYLAFGFGQVEKFAPFTGGGITISTYFELDAQIDNPNVPFNIYYPQANGASTTAVAWLHCELDGIKMWRCNQGATSAITGTDGYFSMSVSPQIQNPYVQHSLLNFSTGASRTARQMVFIQRKDGLGLGTPVGYLRDIRLFTMKNFDPGATFDNDWLVFPGSIKGQPDSTSNPTNTFNSGWYGYAIRNQ